MIRTPQQYIESLNDGRVIFLEGEQIPDITKHPLYQGAINGAAKTYALANDHRWRDLLTYEENSERFMFLWKQPRTSEDLLRRREIFITTQQLGAHLPGMGPDALAASGIIASRIDERFGTHYTDAVEDFREHLKKTDVNITGAITDVKGDRSLRPSAQAQHKDFYVRVVDRQKDGIVVRGAKIHISATPLCNEIIVSPCRAHREEDKDYAVVFATPANAKGITILTQPAHHHQPPEEVGWDWPVHGRRAVSESMIVFDDVFIPWNRVFMCGEWQFSRDQAWLFGAFHRLYGTTRMVVITERFAGAAAAIAEYNGVEKYPHIRKKMAWLAMYSKIIDVMSRAACEHPDIDPGLGFATPNLLYANIAKYTFANDRAQASKSLVDIGGGLATDTFCYKDWMNPRERPLLEKYLGGKEGVPTEHRLRMLRMIKDLTGGNIDGSEIHGEGSLAQQEMAMFASADWERYKAVAKRVAGIPGWEQHPEVGKLPPWHE
ncbi:4-hydroxyphenylacetate 3-hydroxylase N-terminal domain-containing protein [Chloroflexota bacterium]